MNILIKTLAITAILGSIGIGILTLNNHLNKIVQENVACKDYKSWLYINRLYQENPVKYKNLDGDNDGIPCEKLKNKQ